MFSRIRYTAEEDDAYFAKHTLDRLLQIAQDWIVSARGMLEAEYADISGQYADYAHNILEVYARRVARELST